jgi:chromosome segregation ATPase
MAVGVPEADVFAAADRVLERGERPTVERVRVELGRGSPARVGQLLEAWWDALAKRLAGETRLPALPTAASAAFTDLWRVAMDEARTVAQRELDEQRAAVEAERAQFQADRTRSEQQIVEAVQARGEAEGARTQAIERLEDVQRLVTQLEHQAAEATERQKALEMQLQAAERDRRELQEHLATREAAAAQEREAAAQHLRSVEDRSHAEVDRARQEAKVLRTDMERAERVHQQASREAQQRESDLRHRLGQEEKSVGEHAARVRALEEQLARLDGLGEALRSAQEAVRAGLDREAQLRQMLDEEIRRKTAEFAAALKKPTRNKTSAKTKTP